MRELTIFPLLADDETATGPQSRHATLMPCSGQGWQQMHGTVVTLNEHLSDASCETKVTVNLEGWMRIEKIGIDTSVGILPLQRVARQQMQHVVDDM